ncbi:hypothetical protein [Stutzerimonas stutzeri]|uniref:hypothetical protein n=1 Tax=Stutzerimonas stutzeri TaxID=316 RepID=UPI0020C67C51|nr:hypothetical protein [Stutzerimonas stutzeri]
MGVALRQLREFVVGAPVRRGKGRLATWRLRCRLAGKSLLAFLFAANRHIPITSCDVLLIHPSRKSYEQGRKKAFLQALKINGLHVEEFIEESDGVLIRTRQFVRPAKPVPFLLYWHAAHAEFLLRRYRAKVVLTERNGWVVPSFIKVLRSEGMRVMHLAHSVPSGQSSRYDYFDYDYYLLFGRSSYDYLSSLGEAFGECSAVYAGPYYLTDQKKTVRVESDNRRAPRLLFLGSGPEYEQTESYQQYCRWVVAWLHQHRDATLSVKLHPRGRGYPWRDHAGNFERIALLTTGETLEQCAGHFDLVLCGYTNAVLDVARAGVPFVLLGKDEDFFSVARFGLPRSLSEAQLPFCVDQVLAEPEKTKERLSEFLSYHMCHADKPLSSLVDSVRAVANGSEPVGIRLSAPSQKY